jgi:DNA-binding CsgD family transcriptional regulator
VSHADVPFDATAALIRIIAAAGKVADLRLRMHTILTGLETLLDAHASNACLGTFDAARGLGITDVIEGTPWPAHAQDMYMKYLRDDHATDPMVAKLNRIAVASDWDTLAFERTQLVSDEEWYNSRHYMVYRSKVSDACIYAIVRSLSNPNRVFSLSVHRRVGSPQFTLPQVNVLRSAVVGLRESGDSLLEGPQGATMVLANLAPRERRLIEALSRGLSAKQIATELSLTVPTVNTYIRDLYRRLGVSSRGQLFAAMQKAGMTLPERTHRE